MAAKRRGIRKAEDLQDRQTRVCFFIVPYSEGRHFRKRGSRKLRFPDWFTWSEQRGRVIGRATERFKMAQPKSSFLDVTNLSFPEFTALAAMSSQDRTKAIQARTKSKWSEADLLSVTTMTLFEELVAMCIFLFGVPGAVFSLPVIVVVIGLFCGDIGRTAALAAIVLATLAFLPAPFNAKALSSWYALQILRYFSFKAVFAEPIPENKPYILVAPPHGVFPFGNIVTMIAFPSLMGFSFRGLAASAALRVPIFRQLLGTIGAIDASRKSATKVRPMKLATADDCCSSSGCSIR
jgi:hypothetical protein